MAKKRTQRKFKPSPPPHAPLPPPWSVADLILRRKPPLVLVDTYIRGPLSIIKRLLEDDQVEVDEPDLVQIEINKVEFQRRKALGHVLVQEQLYKAKVRGIEDEKKKEDEIAKL